MNATVYYANLFDSFNVLPTDGVHLILRHSVRDKIPFGENGNDIALTREGEALALLLGKQIRHELGYISSSPVGRCINTAKLIAHGAGASTLSIVRRNMWFHPGLFITNTKMVDQYFREDTQGFIARLIKGEAFPGTRPVKEGNQKLLNSLETIPLKKKSMAIHITHDSVLAPIAYGLTGESLSSQKHGWPLMMEGIFLWKENGIWAGRWRGNNFTTKISSN